MIKKVDKDIINNFIKNKKTFIVCTYYNDSFSNLYESKLNKSLNKDLLDIYYLEVEEFMKLFNLYKRVFPIFLFFKAGVLMFKTCGFINYTQLINKFS